MKLNLSPDREGLLLGMIGVLSFSFSLPATKLAVAGFGPVMASLGRAEIAAMIAGTVLLVRREPFPGRRHLRSLLLIGAGIVIGFPLLTSLALRTLPSAHSAVVIALLPATTAAFAVLLARERPPRAFWGAVFIGMLGVLAFAAIQGAGTPHWEDLLLLGAVAAAGYGYAEGGRLSREIGGWRVISWSVVVTAPFLLPFVIADLPNRSLNATAGEWFGLAYVSAVSMYLGFLAWYRGLALGGIARVGQIQLAQPVLTLCWAWLFLDEDVGWQEIFAGLVIVASVALTRRFRYEVHAPTVKTPSETPAVLRTAGTGSSHPGSG
ncbi:MAG: DMT family transporter [Chloroflexota bacterium]|nr:DMT family transporter [Chloroflexota bacterium]